MRYFIFINQNQFIFMSETGIIITVVSVFVLVIAFLIVRWFLSLRRVVKPSEVHVVRESKKTLVYGNIKSITDASGNVIEPEETSGNVYYHIPQWFPIWGIEVQVLPLSNFSVDLQEYEAYDKDKLPFVVDVTAFFRIADYRQAASRIEDSKTLEEHLEKIVQSSVRSILANDTLDEIMIQRSRYGEQFTKEVSENLKEWGIVPVKSIELMDVRDKKGEKVISNIMEKKKSFIDMESRKEVAKNNKEAREAEIEAAQSIAMREEEKEETVGKRRARREKEVGIAQEQSQQDIQEQAKSTKEKEMAVLEVDTVQRANIQKERTIIEANASRERQRIEANTKVDVAEKAKDAASYDAEALYIQTTKASEAELVKEQNIAKAIEAKGLAEATAKEKTGLAEVQPQIMLAKEIGENQGYQSYLIEIKKVEASQAVGVEQAKNLGGAQIKIIANAGSNISEGVGSVMDLFTAKGGQSLGAMVEAFAGTEAGQKLLEKVVSLKDDAKK